MGTFIIIALLTIVPIGILVAFSNSSNDSSSSNHKEFWIFLGFFVIMAFFFYNSYSSKYDPPEKDNDSNELAQRTPIEESDEFINDYREYVQRIQEENSAKKSISKSEIAEGIYVGLTAFLPAVLYLLVIISMDDKKPEPLRILLLTVLIGSAIAVIAHFMGFTLYKHGLSLQEHSIIDSLDIGFLKIALLSEAIKWVSLLVFLRLNKYYDEYVDGVVYSVSLSMGFACILCVGYMLNFIGAPFWTFILQGLVTALIIIPLNMMVGAIMGYFIAIAKHKNKFLNYAFSLLLPFLASGVIYSLLALIGSHWWYYLLFVLVLPPLTAVVYHQIKHLMALDIKESIKQLSMNRKFNTK